MGLHLRERPRHGSADRFLKLPAGFVGDDAIMPTSRTFYIQGANDVIRLMSGLNTNDLYADITSKNELVQIDPTTGKVTTVSGLNSPHGLDFVPDASTSATTHSRMC